MKKRGKDMGCSCTRSMKISLSSQLLRPAVMWICLRNKESYVKLLFAIDVLRKADLIIFAGMGSSGTLAKYGICR